MAHAPVHQHLLDPPGGAARTPGLPEAPPGASAASPALPGGAALPERGSAAVSEALGRPWDLLTFRAPRPVAAREAMQASLARLGTPEAKPPVWRVAQPRWRKPRHVWPARTGYDVHVLRRLSGRRVWYVALVVEDRLIAPVGPTGWVGWRSGDHFAEDWGPKAWQTRERARRDALRPLLAAEKEARLRVRGTSGRARLEALQAHGEASAAVDRVRDPHAGDPASTCYGLTLGWREDQVAERLTAVLASALRAELAALRFLLDPAGAPTVGSSAVGLAAGPRQRGPALGRCSTCGRDLRDELSAARGFGPRCWDAHLLAHPEQVGEVTPLSPRRLRRVLRALEG